MLGLDHAWTISARFPVSPRSRSVVTLGPRVQLGPESASLSHGASPTGGTVSTSVNCGGTPRVLNVTFWSTESLGQS